MAFPVAVFDTSPGPTGRSLVQDYPPGQRQAIDVSVDIAARRAAAALHLFFHFSAAQMLISVKILCVFPGRNSKNEGFYCSIGPD